MSKYGLTVHPEKTRWYGSNRSQTTTPPPREGATPNQGHSTFWGSPTTGVDLCKAYGWSNVRRRKADSIALQALWEWCRANRHRPAQEQHQKLSQKLRGHYAYYGITGNSGRLSAFLRGVRRIWKHWLSRRDRTGMTWADYQRLERRYGLPPARVVQRC